MIHSNTVKIIFSTLEKRNFLPCELWALIVKDRYSQMANKDRF